ncbi:hypothetical protein D3C75_802170 [compost metagenome]
MHLVHQTWVNACFTQHNRCTVSRIQVKALFQQFRCQVNHSLFVAFANRQQRTARFTHGGLATQHCFGERFCESATHAHHFTGRAHFWP